MSKNVIPFLEQVAQRVCENHGSNLENVKLVVPGNRAGIYLRKHLANVIGKPFIAPAIESIAVFLESASGKQITDNSILFFELFNIQKNQTLTFEEFRKWGSSVLSDFNEIDNYLLAPEVFFQDLKNFDALEEWSLNDDPLTKTQQDYISFWNSMSDLYHDFNHHLDEHNMWYGGKLRKYVVTQLNQLFNANPESHIYFIGFNALTKSEQEIFFGLQDKGLATIIWDTDDYYLNDSQQEAGYFFREYNKQYKQDITGESHFKAGTKNICFHEATLPISEVRLAGQLLEKIDPNKSSCVVLADEKLLIPFLYSLPENTNAINVTMGYALKSTPFWSLIETFFEMHINASSRRNGGLYHKDFFKLVYHPEMIKFLGKNERDVLSMIRDFATEEKPVLFHQKELDALTKKVPAFTGIRFLFDPISATTALTTLINFYNQLSAMQQNKWSREILFQFVTAAKELHHLITSYGYTLELKTVSALYKQFCAQKSIDFVGEPLEGLQVMGMLETRALNFDHVIIIGANEGILPHEIHDQSFIPYDLKIYHGLPVKKQREAMYAYYFYRLLQHCTSADIIYCVESGDLGSLEKSRYLAQIEQELPVYNADINIQTFEIHSPETKTLFDTFKVPKDDQIIARIDQILEHGLSPSAINTYLNCPLNFYYKYVLRLRELNEMEELMEVSTFGSIVHAVLENFFKSCEGRVVQENDIKRFIKNVNEELDAVIEDIYGLQMMKYGQNHLVRSVAEEYLVRYLKSELRKIKDLKETISIVALEHEMKCTIDFTPYGFNKKVTFYGMADRIEKSAGVTHLIDYKTGAVDTKDVVFNMADEKVPSDKVIQLMLYLLMYHEMTGTPYEKLQASILSLRSLSKGNMLLSERKNGRITEEIMQGFLHRLADIFTSIYDRDVPFTHTLDAPFCQYCEI